MSEHFKGCHPEDSTAPPLRPPYIVTDPEPCWHDDTPTPRGCYCPDCLDSDDDIPAEMIYHCPLCGRWWSYMYMRYIELILGREPQ